MPDGSAIEWTDATWNPVTGCTKVGAGCDNCYAERFAERFRDVAGHPYERGFDLTLRPDRLDRPLRWRKPRMIFVNSMSDLFHKDIPLDYTDRVFNVMQSARHHIFQVLTKRSSRMRRYLRRPVRNLRRPETHLVRRLDRGPGGAVPAAPPEGGSGRREVPVARTPPRPPRRARPREHFLGDRRGRERSGRPSDGGGMGPGHSRPVRPRRRCVLLQAVGRADAEGGRASSGRSGVERAAGIPYRPGVTSRWSAGPAHPEIGNPPAASGSEAAGGSPASRGDTQLLRGNAVGAAGSPATAGTRLPAKPSHGAVPGGKPRTRDGA